MSMVASAVVTFALLFEEFRAASWTAWLAILSRITPDVRELYVAAGRGSGKSRVAALLACAYASRRYTLAPGERIYIGVFAPDRKQAGVTFRYVVGLLRSVPELAALIAAERQGSVELHNGVTVEVLTASTAAPRGRSYILAIVEEAAFLPSDTSVNPDVELVRALRPGLARVPGSLLVVVSSPYRRAGILYEASRKYSDGADPHVVYVQAPTLELNPTFDAASVDRAYTDDPASAAAEYGGLFRSDIESFVERAAVEACIVTGRHELPRAKRCRYFAFVDPSGGRSDAFTLAIGHAERTGSHPIAVVDSLRERLPPFSPEEVVTEFARLLQDYGVTKVTGDRYGGEWPREAFKRHGIVYETAAKPKSDIYRDALALLNGGRVELPDTPKLVNQLVGLERRTARGGRDSIDHGPGGHDDLANAVCGLAGLLAVTTPRKTSATWGRRTTVAAVRPTAPRPVYAGTIREELDGDPRRIARARLRWARSVGIR